MLSFLGDRFKYLISSLLRPLIIIMAPEPSSSLFPPYPLSVTAYESLVSGSYIFRKDQPNENAEHFRVKEVRLYKCRSHPFHEYVIAHVSSPNIKSAYLRLERTRVKPKEEDTTEEDFLSRLPNTALADAFKEAISEAEESENFAPEDTPTPSPPHCPQPGLPLNPHRVCLASIQILSLIPPTP
ncbi:hypothetical protein CPB84DRAFT_259687 [Gymnopilus junonius]|uniref:Uncharacterized protein n=1 Tax=Gymnopilus junonius TaxID=109634 RepID=A0A9P5TH97_GYMJU|nr:hypothetical protein CPB84DRAFT_259687 [Gymnopilus junonius]